MVYSYVDTYLFTTREDRFNGGSEIEIDRNRSRLSAPIRSRERRIESNSCSSTRRKEIRRPLASFRTGVKEDHTRSIANPRVPLTCITRRRKLEFARIRGWSSVETWKQRGFLEMGVNRSARRFNCWKPPRSEQAERVSLSLSLSRARARPARPSFNSG